MAGNPFLLAPEVNANPLLSDSWSRCQRYGLDPATEDFPRLGAGELADRLASHRGLQQLAQPVVEALSRQGRRPAVGGASFPTPTAWCCILSAIPRRCERPSAWRWLPAICGVKAGAGPTPSAPRSAIDDGCGIDGRQHFLTRNQNLYCAAMPLRRPDGSIAGVLDISGRRIFPTSTPSAG